jgi:hypothetical protein
MAKLFTIVLCLIVLNVTPSLAGHTGVGQVKVVNGRVDVIRGGTTRQLKNGAKIYHEDFIRTSSGGSIGITFQDGTTLSLGSDGELTIDDFVYDPAANELSFVTRLSAGVLTFTTGVIGKLRPESVRIVTPLANIGIRGTRFIVSVEDP